MISAASATISPNSVGAHKTHSSEGETDVLRLKTEVSAKRAEIGDCDCEDTKKKLEVELRNLQAELVSAQSRQGASNTNDNAGDDKDQQAAKGAFSGESDRIGTTNFDESTPFGQRVAYL